MEVYIYIYTKIRKAYNNRKKGKEIGEKNGGMMMIVFNFMYVLLFSTQDRGYYMSSWRPFYL